MILYYCLEIHRFWRLYGDKINDPGIAYDGSFLRTLILRLIKSGSHYEGLRILEDYVETPDSPIEKLALSLIAEDNPAFVFCMLLVAKSHAEQRNLEESEDMIDAIEESIDDALETVSIYCQIIKLRFLEEGTNGPERVNRLIQLSKRLHELENYNLASHALDYAAGLAETLPEPAQTATFGHQIDNSLRAIWSAGGDHLSFRLNEFHYCDFLNSSTGDLASARARRNELLSSPMSDKFPYFQCFHKRQWAEYFMLHQRENALYHAEKYLEYCKKCRDGEEQSLAENIRLQTILQPYRTSEEKRIDELEDICSQLRRGIETDRQKSWFGARAEKQLLLVEALVELGRLQEEETEDVASEAREILMEAETASDKIDKKADNAFVKSEIAYLKASASLLLNGQFPEQSTTPPPPRDDDLHSAGRLGSSFSLQVLLLAAQNECLQTFQQMFNRVNERVGNHAGKETMAKQAEALGLKAMLCYLLMELDTPKIQQLWALAGFSSRIEGAELVLKSFEQAFDLKDQIEQEARDKSPDKSVVKAVAASEAYFTSDLEQLYFDISLELAFGLQDKDLTWEWIQRRKARGFSKSLKSLVPEYAPKRIDHLGTGSRITFEDLQFVQTASATRLVFVDWIVFGTCPAKLLFFSFCMGRDDDGPIAIREMFEIEAPLEELKRAAENVDERRMNYDDAERYLLPFLPVIQPLRNCSSEGDILILSPTSPLHNVPLHAVPLENKLLIERNPLVYVPSHGALVSCLQRLDNHEPGADVPAEWKATIFGAYDDTSSEPETVKERTEIYQSLESLGGGLGCTPTIGNDLTVDSMKQCSASSKLIHFHGHGILDPHSPSRQSLVLGPRSSPLTIDAIASLNLNAAHVTLIACSGGVQDFSLSGDEPLGLFSSFILGGATSVIGALWPIQSSTGRLFTQVFYKYFLGYMDWTELGPIVNLARALQHAVLEIRKRDDTRRPYNWAPFVLYGVWFCGRKPGTW